MDWLSKEEIEAKYRHVSTHEMPFETNVVEIIPQKGINFSDRWKFLKGLFFIVEDGFYFQYDDVCNGIINRNQDGQPYDLYLDGAFRCVYSYAFCSSVSEATALLMRIISEGILCIGKDKYNILHFTFVNHGYSYLPSKSRNNSTSHTSNTTNNNKKLGLKEILNLITQQYDDFSKVGNFWCVKRKNEPSILYDDINHKKIELSFDEVVYGNYKREYGESSLIESGYNDYFIKSDRKWGCLDENGHIKIDCLYDYIEHFGGFIEDGYLVTNYQKKGLISSSGDVIIPCHYDKIERFGYYSGLYSARINNKYYIWSGDGQCLKKDLDECVFVGSYSNTESDTYEDWDIFWIKKQGIGVIVRGDQFESITDAIYNQYKEAINYMGSIIIVVAKYGCYGVINEKGDTLIDFIYDDLCIINEETLKVRKGGKCGIISCKNVIVPINYDEIFPVFTYNGSPNSFIGIIGKDKYLLDINGNVLFSNYDYDDVLVEYEDSVIGCHVKKDDKWGFVTQNGSPWIPCCYEGITTYTDNGAVLAFEVCIDGKYGVIDVHQKVLVECLYKELHFFKTSLFNIFVYKDNDKSAYYAFIDSEIQLESKQYWQIKNELERRGYGKC